MYIRVVSCVDASLICQREVFEKIEEVAGETGDNKTFTLSLPSAR